MGTKSTSENANLTRSGREKTISPQQHERIRELWLQGMTLSEMAEATGIPRTTLHKFITMVLRPEAHAAGVRQIGELLAEMQMLRWFAWQQLEQANQPQQRITEKTIRLAADSQGKSKKKSAAITKAYQRIVQLYPNQSARNWAQIIQWCIEQECRLGGYYRSQPQSPESEFRVAGYTPNEINEMMIARISEKIQEIRRQAEARKQFQGH